MSDILIHFDQGVLTITLNRVNKKNSITASMYSDMAIAILEAEQSKDTRVLVFQGNETIFSAGNDIGDFLNTPASNEEAPVFHFLKGIATFSKPMIASVCGPAVGIGTTLLFHCDLVYAGDNAAFSMPFVNLGLCPEAASSLLVPRMMGYHRAAEVLLMGDPFLAETALEMGLVNRVLPPSEVNAYAQKQAARLAAKPMSALIATKRLLKSSQTEEVLLRIKEEGAIFGRMLREPAAREAFGAFMEKRKPKFSKL